VCCSIVRDKGLKYLKLNQKKRANVTLVLLLTTQYITVISNSTYDKLGIKNIVISSTHVRSFKLVNFTVPRVVHPTDDM